MRPTSTIRGLVVAGAIGLCWGGSDVAEGAPGSRASGPAEAGSRRLSAPAWTTDAKAPGVRDAARGLPGRWQRDLAERKARLAKHRGKDPAAILALLGALGRLAGDVPPEDLQALLSGVHRDTSRHPLVRAYAGSQLARMKESAGDTEGARAALAAEGALLSWQIVGPFDNAGKSGHDQAYPPESVPFDAEQTMVGKLPTEPLSWRAYDYAGIPRGGYVSFDDVLRPNEQVVGYATCWVNVKRDTDAVVHLGTGGAYKVWVDRGEVGEGDAYRLPHPLQDAHAVKLRAGWNRMLIKVGAMEGAWGFYAALRNLDGTAIEGMVAQSEPPAGWTDRGDPSVHRSFETARPLSLREALEDAYPGLDPDAKRPGSVARGLALVELYRWIHPHDRDDETAAGLARRVDERAKTWESAWLLAMHERDAAGSRLALMDAIARARKDKRARGMLGHMLLELAWRERSLGLEYRYRELVDEAMEVAPDDVMIELALADRVAEDGYHWLGLTWVRDMLARYPESETLHHELASRLRGQGRTKEALAVLETMAATAGRERSLVSERIDALLSLGKAEQAAELARRAAQAAPGLPEAHARLAHLEQARGDTEAARKALAKAIALSPHDARLHTELGLLLARDGDASAAASSLRRSLELVPQQPEVRDLLASLEDNQGEDLLAKYGVELAKVGAAKTPDAWKGKSAGILHHRVAVRVHENGLTDRLEHRIIRILDDRGVRGQSVQGMSYDPAESYVDVRRARVRRADGTIEDLGESHTVALASAGYRMYYDQRQVQVRFHGLRVGDTLEIAFIKRDVAARNMFDEYFGDMVPLQGIEPRKHVEYVLEAPSGKTLYFNRKVEKKKLEDGTTIYRHVEKDVPGFKPEGGMPGWTEFARYLHVSTYENWDDVGRWYWDLVEGQLVVDDKIRKGVAEATSGLAEDAKVADKVAAIYEHVVRNTRYVGLEFGIHGFKPYRTTDVYSRRFGDCKDKASLLKVMLGEVGIDSHLVLVRTRDQGTIPATPASLSAFNHAIVYVPALDLFLDGTAEWSGPNELPTGDQGASVLVVKDGKGGTFRKIPVSPPKDNQRITKQTITLQPDGGAALDHEIEVSGSGASQLRFQFQSEEARRERLAKAFGDTYPGAEVESTGAPGIGDILKPARIEAKLTVPSWGNPEGEGRRFSVLGRESQLAPSLAPLAERTHDLLLDAATIERQTILYRLPPRYRFARIPKGKTLETPVGSYELSVAETSEGAKVTSELRLTKQRITPKEYRKFRELLRQVDEALEQSFEITPAK